MSSRRLSATLFASLLIASASAQAAEDVELAARVERLERAIESQRSVEMFRRLETLQQELQRLRGSVDEMNHSIEGIKRRQRDLYLDIDRRLAALEGRNSDGQQDTAAAPAAVPSADSGVSADDRQELADYQAAFEILRNRRYDDAIVAFKTYIEKYPSGKYIANARYWLGEANYVSRRFPVAIEELNKVLSDYPQSNKVPDALLKIGFSYYEMQQWAEARASLQRLVDKYPSTTAANLAQKRLDSMDKDGR